MKALITGANGFTGSHLVQALEQRGDSVVGLVRKSSKLTRLANSQIQLIYGDITDREALKTAMTGVDTVFHTAAYVELGLVNETEMERVNVEGTRAVLEVAQASGVSRLVYCSTIGVYGDTKGQIIDETFNREQTDFSSAYDRTKYQAQQIVDRFAVQGFPVISVFPAGVFGSDDPHFGPVIQQFLKGRLKLWPGGDKIIGVVHVDDLVNAMILAAEKGQPGSHYIVSSGDLTTREMFEILSQKTGIPVPKEAPKAIVRFIGNLLDPIGHLLKWNPPIGRERLHYVYDRFVRVDASKVRRELSWQPRSISETLQELIVNS